MKLLKTVLIVLAVCAIGRAIHEKKWGDKR
jgi:hypothetical protein